MIKERMAAAGDIVVIIDINSLFIVCKTIDNKNLFVPIDMIVNFTQT